MFSGYNFNIQKQDFYRLNEDVLCSSHHYVYLKNNFHEICVHVTGEGSNKRSNIYVKRSKTHGKTWEEIIPVLREDTNEKIKNYITLTSEEGIIIFYVLTNEAGVHTYYTSPSVSGKLFQKNKQVSLPNNFTSKYRINSSYSLPSFEFNLQQHMLLCGIKKHYDLYFNQDLISCLTTTDLGETWGTQLYFSLRMNFNSVKPIRIEPKIFGSELGFKVLVTHNNTSSPVSNFIYIKCEYTEWHFFDCFLIDMKYPIKQIHEIHKSFGSYILVQSVSKKNESCYLYYNYSSMYVIKHREDSSKESLCANPQILNIDDGRFIFTFTGSTEGDRYGYVFNYRGKRIHCKTNFKKNEDGNIGFLRKKDDSYVCSMQFDELAVYDEDRYLVLSSVKPLQVNFKKCFLYTYDPTLKPVETIHKVETENTYNGYILYILYFKSHLEYTFLHNISIKCHLGDQFFIQLYLNSHKRISVSNNSTLYPDKTIHLYPDEIFKFRDSTISKVEEEDKFSKKTELAPRQIDEYLKLRNSQSFMNFSEISTEFEGKGLSEAPPGTRYVNTENGYTIYLLPSVIEHRNYISSIDYVNKNMKEKKQIIMKQGGQKPRLFGVDFSNSNRFYVNSQKNLRGNIITIRVSLAHVGPIILGLVCRADTGYQNMCFNEVFERGRIKPIRDVLKDFDGNVTIYPKMYVYQSKKEEKYEESRLIIQPKFTQIFSQRRKFAVERYSFSCHCYDYTKKYDVHFILD